MDTSAPTDPGSGAGHGAPPSPVAPGAPEAGAGPPSAAGPEGSGAGPEAIPPPARPPAPPGDPRAPGALEPLRTHDPSAIAGYRLLGRLGAGGMGVVYLGRTDAGELAAVKVTLSGQAEDPDFRARFRREVAAARRVSSPWAVPVTAADPDAPEPWLATVFVPGPSLAETIAAHGPLPPRSVRVLGVALARALAAVHDAGLIHRDVKPGNVLLAVDGPRLIDFGIARTADETALTATDMVVGTPGFLAPEQAEARGADIGPPSDVFALACLLAHALTGRLPFGRGAVDALLYRTVHDDPDLRGIEPGLARLLADCLAKDPRQRPTAVEITGRLAEDAPRAGADWLPPEVVRTIAERSARMLALPGIEPTGAGEPGPPRSPGRRRLLIAAGAAAVLALGGGAVLRAGPRDDRTAPGGPPASRRWVIGVQADLSGPRKETGIEQERGARLAVDAFNARADRPFSVGLRAEDDAGDRARALTAARRLADDREVAAVLGSTGDYTTEAVLPVYEEAVLPLMTVSAGLGTLTKEDSRTFSRACPAHTVTATQLAYALQAFYAERGTPVARPGLLQDRTDDSYGWQYTAMANHMLQSRYGHRTHPRVVPASVGSYDTVIGEMVEAGIDAYLHGGGARSAAKAARALRAARYDGPLLAGQQVLSQEFLKLAGDAAEGWVIGAPVADPARKPEARTFVAAYRRRYGRAPGFYAGESFDAVGLMLRELAAAARGGERPEREKLAAAVRGARYTGVMGGYRFTPEKGDLDGFGTCLYVVEDGRFRFLADAPTKDPGRVRKT
ncbi:bifunctional serine/threonine-protein kinase/ABC transporter substrate-binding protein [Streptomyces sp. NPDC001985]|uniref:bifunctional serine/threonine-protein kinase/ABC transporter substrate-binding protein n=1 Tax=Streptomyces sp. NPDC001985 TaxID=3154406 RepID=UPI00331F7230